MEKATMKQISFIGKRGERTEGRAEGGDDEDRVTLQVRVDCLGLALSSVGCRVRMCEVAENFFRVAIRQSTEDASRGDYSRVGYAHTDLGGDHAGTGTRKSDAHTGNRTAYDIATITAEPT